MRIGTMWKRRLYWCVQSIPTSLLTPYVYSTSPVSWWNSYRLYVHRMTYGTYVCIWKCMYIKRLYCKHVLAYLVERLYFTTKARVTRAVVGKHDYSNENVKHPWDDQAGHVQPIRSENRRGQSKLSTQATRVHLDPSQNSIYSKWYVYFRFFQLKFV